ncbi:uncharacterized protein LOC122376123 [Amphibalanus amphitrite]|uniref:uncharacterized protein LOC122376123 n=1 Tax=Amphibalanus amphitrite TaxID=1232801 RepID=UPI001C920636|nr:uncharacterized protein LOC122376123 [Amphibalanus amphitrite]
MAIPIRRKTSAAVATAFEHHALVALLRKPKRVLTDNGPEFCGPEFEKVLINWGINHVYSTPLRPEGNGAVERCNRSLSQALRLLSDSAADWDGQLARALVTYNTTRHSELKESPAEFLLQRKHGGVSGPIVSSEIQNSWKPGHPEFAPFRVGELVKKEAHHPGNMLVNKFQRRYDGPFVVTRVNNNGVTYIVKSEDGQEKRVHHSQLRPWKKPPAYLLRSGRCMQDLISVAPDPSLQETSAVDSAERSQDASRMSPPPPLESPRPGAGAVAEASPVASAAPPPPSSSAGLHSSRLMTDAATGTSPVASAAPPPPSSSAGPHSSRLMTDAATGTSPVASAAPPPPSSSVGLHSSRLMTDAATGTSPVATRVSAQQTSPGLRGALKVRFDVPSLRRSQRARRPPVRFADYVMD